MEDEILAAYCSRRWEEEDSAERGAIVVSAGCCYFCRMLTWMSTWCCREWLMKAVVIVCVCVYCFFSGVSDVWLYFMLRCKLICVYSHPIYWSMNWTSLRQVLELLTTSHVGLIHNNLLSHDQNPGHMTETVPFAKEGSGYRQKEKWLFPGMLQQSVKITWKTNIKSQQLKAALVVKTQMWFLILSVGQNMSFHKYYGKYGETYYCLPLASLSGHVSYSIWLMSVDGATFPYCRSTVLLWPQQQIGSKSVTVTQLKVKMSLALVKFFSALFDGFKKTTGV